MAAAHPAIGENHMDQLLDELVQRMKQAYGSRLVSVFLYGSAASGDYQGRWSDLNVFCVLESIGAGELADGEPVVRWWRDKGSPAPVLMSRMEVRTSTDSFPIEFRDLIDCRRLLHGDDVIAGLEVDETHYRIMVEHELRAKLLRLRQKAAGALSENELLLRLMTDSISTFCVLIRHALRLATGSNAPKSKRDAVRGAEERLGIPMQAFYKLLDLRDGTVKARSVDPPALFREYLGEIESLVRAVDELMR